MKVALVVMEGRSTIALTGENEFEKRALRSFFESSNNGCVAHEGSFYECQGGWIREGGKSHDSLLITASKGDNA